MNKMLDKVLGCVIGAAIGDSIGGPVEFSSADFVRWRLDGKDWLEDMIQYKGKKKDPFGIWRDEAPKGTATDDTRLNQVFLNCVVRNRGIITPQFLALQYINEYQDVEKNHARDLDMAKLFYGSMYNVCCAFLGVDSPQLYNGMPLHVVQNPPGIPGLAGLLTLQSVGLLYPNDPERAYKKAYELSFLDIGYATDAVALMSATVSAAFGDKVDAKEIVDAGIKTNPYGFGDQTLIGFRHRRLVSPPTHQLLQSPHRPSLLQLFKIADNARNERELIIALAKECAHLDGYDSLDVLGVALTAIRYHNGDPVRSILTSANHRWVNDKEELIQMKDVDCVAMVTGALVGAMRGLNAFPKDWVQSVLHANKEAYGFDLEQNATDFYNAVHQQGNTKSEI